MALLSEIVWDAVLTIPTRWKEVGQINPGTLMGDLLECTGSPRAFVKQRESVKGAHEDWKAKEGGSSPTP